MSFAVILKDVLKKLSAFFLCTKSKPQNDTGEKTRYKGVDGLIHDLYILD